MSMKPLRSVVAIIACGFLLPALVSSAGCKKDEPPPPLPSAAPAASTVAAAPQTLELAPEPAPSESADVKKPTGTGGPATSLKKCCAALAQNATLAPPGSTQALALVQASQACNIAVGAGAASPAVLAAVRGALGGAALPAGCQ
jgi:hypothetical protein